MARRRPPPRKLPPAPEQPQAQQLGHEQVIEIQRNHVEICRAAFYKLAQARGADRVLRDGHTLADAQAYADAEMAGLDQQLANATPAPEGNS